jgi:cytochrome c oxidase cbb3-type subunit 1
MQGLMCRGVNPDGTLTYTFVESVKATFPFFLLRLIGGLLYLAGMLIMLWNVLKTVTAGQATTVPVPLAAAAHA